MLNYATLALAGRPWGITSAFAPLRVGPFGENSVPVLEGLKANDWIVSAGVHVLHQGQEVRPIDRSNRTINVMAKE